MLQVDGVVVEEFSGDLGLWAFLVDVAEVEFVRGEIVLELRDEGFIIACLCEDEVGISFFL